MKKDKYSIEEKYKILNDIKLIKYTYENKFSIEDVAIYYEVSIKAIHSAIARNQVELEENIEILNGNNLTKIKNQLNLNKYLSSLKLIDLEGLFKIGLLLKESVVSNMLKSKIEISYIPRKEINFKDNMDKYLNTLKNEYTKRRKEYFPNFTLNEDIFKYEFQKYLGENRVDFYFPLMNLVVEYDEDYHEYKKQRDYDKRRENELILELNKKRFGYFSELINDTELHYIPDETYVYFDAINSKYSCCEEAEDKYKNSRENYHCDCCRYADISKIKNSVGDIIRINHNNEAIGFMKLVAYIMNEVQGF